MSVPVANVDIYSPVTMRISLYSPCENAWH